MGDADMVFTGGDAILVLGAEAAFVNEGPVDGDQVAFGRVRIRINVDTPGTYLITHPFGTLEQVITQADIGSALEINVSDDIGNFTTPGPAGDFTAMLGSSIGPFLFWDSELPGTDPGTPGAFYIGNPTVEHTVLGSPFGTNFFRIERDGGSGCTDRSVSRAGKGVHRRRGYSPHGQPGHRLQRLSIRRYCWMCWPMTRRSIFP